MAKEERKNISHWLQSNALWDEEELKNGTLGVFLPPEIFGFGNSQPKASRVLQEATLECLAKLQLEWEEYRSLARDSNIL